MALTIYDAAVPVFTNALTDMRAWLDKAAVVKPEAELLAAKLTDDMRPFPAQIQMASDAAKGAVARLAGVTPPPMADTEASLAELRDRIDRTLAFIASVDPAAVLAGDDRPIELKFPNGMGYRFTGAAFLTGFALPNFFFHITTAYAILRAEGVPLGKSDFLAHLGQPLTDL
ncbi:DUF1993 domain-containing protein [Sandarakinorhabdus sp. DWP1-3-1]|uniref:DUF1993 domain-containing protein n=1 Tax=Sandarakinorhabdus sp. DWP1-3-1 TaxID=2804627 RepID=UPI003CF049B5